MSVSYCITVYNKERFLDAVLAAAFRECAKTGGEVIAIDDGSRDGSAAIMRRYEQSHGLRAVYQKNAGVFAATNRAIDAAAERYIRLIDSDDVILPGSTMALIDALERHNARVAYGHTGRYDPPIDADTLSPIADRPDTVMLDDPQRFLIHAVALNPSVTLMRRHDAQSALPLTESFRSAQEFSLLLRLGGMGPFVRLEEPVALLPKDNPGSLSKNMPLMYNNMCLMAAEEIEAGRLSSDLARFAARRFAMRCWLYFRRHDRQALGLGDVVRLLSTRLIYPAMGRAACIRSLRRSAALYERAMDAIKF